MRTGSNLLCTRKERNGISLRISELRQFVLEPFIKPGVHCIQTKDRSRISAAQLTPLFDHPPYSPDLAPGDLHLFLKLKVFLGCKRFGRDKELEIALTIRLNELAAEEYDMGILKLVDRYD
ncbi:hypothetical protein AVEN_191140-1 [Araneus ventricosus]|uniref:Histone-lysine N-methyltransferase SETMAR n=1 Tax=Araneus ventricosus TaxID=182803 RepID=A0A4Y2AY46_ARAVE|nr:hypothetical protein AVEN_191140-1 [Araneus ventricosus]